MYKPKFEVELDLFPRQNASLGQIYCECIDIDYYYYLRLTCIYLWYQIHLFENLHMQLPVQPPLEIS